MVTPKVISDDNRTASENAALPPLNGHDIRKGTGDVLKDIDYALRFVDGDGIPGVLGLEVEFINRVLRVVRGEIRQCRARHGKKAAASPQWQPIATAPKDGTQVWLWWDKKRRLGRWHEAENPPSIGGRFANWLTDDKGSVSAVTKPTHWMPLPAPPEAT